MTPEDRARSPALQTARAYQESAYQEIDSLLASLNFATREYEVRVERAEEEYDRGRLICKEGHLHTFKNKIAVEDIQKRFGGGKYIIKIFGPHPTTGRPGIIKTEKVPISGLSIPDSQWDRGGRDNSDDERGRRGSETAEAIRAVAEMNERTTERVVQALDRRGDVTSVVTELIPVIQPILEKFLGKSDNSMRVWMEQTREERRQEETRRGEERRRDEEWRLEQRRLEDERKREEREDRLRAEDARKEQERRADEARKEQAREERERERDDREKERERAREERDRLREEARAETSASQRQHERDMALLTERNKQDAERQREFLGMMQNFTTAQMDMLAARQETGGVKAVTEQLLMLTELKDTLTGENREADGFEKFTDGLDHVVKTVTPLGKGLMNAWERRQGAQTGGPAPNPRSPSPPPGTPIGQPVVVDVGPARTPFQNPNPPPLPQARTQPATPFQTPPAPADAAANPKNDLTDFCTPPQGSDMLQTGQILIQNVDLAVQQGLTPEQIVAKVLDPFETAVPMLMAMARGFSREQLVQFLSDNVPPDWALMTPRGEEVAVAAFELWRDTELEAGV
jgi:hypothetical protein